MRAATKIFLLWMTFFLAFAHGQSPYSTDYETQVSKEWQLEVDACLASKYIWRGVNVSDRAVFQPALTVSYRDFSVTQWGNMELTDDNQDTYGRDPTREFTEMDLSLDWQRSFYEYTLSTGLIHYVFPNTGSSRTSEFYLGGAIDILFKPSLTLFWDLDAAKGGLYWHGAFEHSFSNVIDSQWGKASLNLKASFAYASAQYNLSYHSLDKSLWHDYALTASLPFELGTYWILEPSFAYTCLWSKELRDQAGDKKSHFTSSLSLNYAF